MAGIQVLLQQVGHKSPPVHHPPASPRRSAPRPGTVRHCQARPARVSSPPKSPATEPSQHDALGDLIVALDHRDDRQAELAGELEVAVVVRGHGHDGAGAVAHHHVVGDPFIDLKQKTLSLDRLDKMTAIRNRISRLMD